MSSNFKGLHPALIPFAEYLLLLIRQRDPGARVTSVRRSTSEQGRLWRRWLSGVARYPAAPPGKSKHEGRAQTGGYSIAFDISARKDALEWAGQVWEGWGGRWGGRFNDPIHFEV